MNARWIIISCCLCLLLVGCIYPDRPEIVHYVQVVVTATPRALHPEVSASPPVAETYPLPDSPKEIASATRVPGVRKEIPQLSGFNQMPSPACARGFEATLSSGEWRKYLLGPSFAEGGYVVDVTPLEPSVDGAHVEQKILPEYDGEQWSDVLWLLLPEKAEPLRVSVCAYSTADWPVVFESRLTLTPGEWHGFGIQSASLAGGYVVDIDPVGEAPYGSRIEKVLLHPEFPGEWVDVLRIQTPADGEALTADVRVYRTPDLPIVSEFDATVEPGGWPGFWVGDASSQQAYVVEVTPLVDEDNQIDTFIVQPEFNGQTWNDILRLQVPDGRPPMEVHIRVYEVGQ